MLIRLVLIALILLGAGVGTSQARPVELAEEPVAAAARPPESEPFLRWMARASGLIGVVILLMSFYLIALASWMAFEYRAVVAMPPALIGEVNELLADKQFAEAYQRLNLNASFFARTLAAGVRRLPSGLPSAQRAMEMTNEDETMRREHRTSYLATVGTLGPMIGLLGTVYGMIRSFQVMATSGTSPQAGQLAEGISTALFATLEGISISVPAIALYALFRNRIARMSLEVAILSETMLEQFAPGIRTPHPLASAQPRSTSPRSEA